MARCFLSMSLHFSLLNSMPILHFSVVIHFMDYRDNPQRGLRFFCSFFPRKTDNHIVTSLTPQLHFLCHLLHFCHIARACFHLTFYFEIISELHNVEKNGTSN